MTIVGLPDAAVRESRERIRAAIQNCGYFFPLQKTTINLAPADVRKEGASFDLPIALGILGANGDLAEAHNLIHILCVGELSLDGRVRPIKGALPIAILAREASIRHVILPEENAKEAAVVSGINVYPVTDLRSAVNLVAICVRSSSGAVARRSGGGTGPDRTLQRRFQRSARTNVGEARARDRERRRAQHPPDWTTRFGQDDAGETVGDNHAAA